MNDSTVQTAVRKRAYPAGGRVARTIQVMRGHASPGAAHQHELKVKSDARTLMIAYRVAGSREVGERMLADLRAALHPEMPALTPELICRAEEADAAEDECQTRWLTDKTPANARRYRIAIETAGAVNHELALALRQVEQQ